MAYPTKVGLPLNLWFFQRLTGVGCFIVYGANAQTTAFIRPAPIFISVEQHVKLVPIANVN